MKTIHLICHAVIAVGAIFACCAEEAPPDFSILIKRLSSENYDERTAAYQRLHQAGLTAENALRQAARSPDAEVRLRIDALLKRIDRENMRIAERQWMQTHLGALLGAGTLEQTPAVETGKAKAATDRQLENCLQWLAQAQEEDGHYDSVKHGAAKSADIEQTALALLAFLSVGHTERVGQYKVNVQRAVAWLLSRAREDGAIVRANEEPDGLAHCLAGMALAEAYGMSQKNAAAKEAAQKAVDYSVNLHRVLEGPGLGGFGREARSKTPDLFTTALFSFQVKSAKVAGLKVPPETWEGINQFTDSCFDPATQRFRLAAALKPSATATVWGCLCRYFTGSKREDLEAIVIPALHEQMETENSGCDLMTEWAGKLLALQQAGATWKDYAPFSNQRLNEQFEDGERNNGSVRPFGEWRKAGRVFSTSLSPLILSIWVRYPRLVE